ncbi:MAG: hypothetical protein QCI38_09290, partial [Candidatus Thermoplasmatota archaeon]|nr:hypothetical protein [Candidatus Thermoplasmatota archaeon]
MEGSEEDVAIFSGLSIQQIFSGDNLLLVGIAISSFGALWGSLASQTLLFFLSFLVLTIALVYIRFPKSWASVFWIGATYSFTFIGTVLALGWIGREVIIGLIGMGGILLGAASGLFFIDHVKRARDDAEGDYIPLGIWSLVFLSVIGLSIASAIGFFSWAKGGDLWIYLITEGAIIVLMPYVLLKTEEVGAGIIRPDEILHYGEEKCPACSADLLLETRKCPECGSSRLFKWCTICESYSTICPECK